MKNSSEKQPSQFPSETPETPSEKSQLLNQSVSTLIDYSAYANPEFSDRLSEVLSIPENVRSVFRTASLYNTFVILLLLLLFWDFDRDTSEILIVIMSISYGFATNVLLGVLLGIMVVLNRSLDHIVQILDLMLEMTDNISNDIKGILTGQKQRPSMNQVMNGVNVCLILPTIKKLIAKQLGIFGSFIFWIYRLTLDRVVDKFLNLLPEQQIAPDGPALSDEEIHESQSQISEIESWMKIAREKLQFFGHGLRRLVVVPLAIVWTVAFIASYIPLIAAWYYLHQ